MLARCLGSNMSGIRQQDLLSLSMISSSDILPFSLCLSTAFEAESPSGQVTGAGIVSITERVYIYRTHRHSEVRPKHIHI